jgi:DNA-binding response OmpR family regulator
MEKQRPVVLIVDDEIQTCRNLSQYFEEFDDVAVLTAVDGEEGLNILVTGRVDLAIIDLRLPGLSGFDLIKISKERGDNVRFIVHTGSADLALTEEFQMLELADADLFLKPASLDRLRSRVLELLGLDDLKG